MNGRWILGAVLLLSACEPAGATCVTGQSVACTGTGGCSGSQVCGADGTFGPCACDGDDAGPVDGGPPDAGPGDAGTDAPAPACGDLTVNAGEACDDGNVDACDGCDACEERHALRFSEDTTLLEVTDSEVAALISELTVEFWFRLAPGPGLPPAVAVNTRNAAGGWTLAVTGSAVSVTTAGGVETFAMPTTLIDATWHHVAWVRSTSRSVGELYLDGHALGWVTHIPRPGGPLVVGPRITGTGALVNEHRAGEIDELRASRTARYSIAFEPERRFAPDVDTVALYHFDEGEGTVAHDDSPLAADGTYRGPVAFVDEGRYGTCVPEEVVTVQDVSSRPIAITLGGRAFTVDGLSSIGVVLEMIETPLPDGRTHKVPDRPRFRDVTLRGIRGSSADVAWLAAWAAAPTPIDGQVTLVEAGGITSVLPMSGLGARSGGGTPTDLGGGRARLDEVVISVGGFGELDVMGDAMALRGLPCPGRIIGFELDGIFQAILDPATAIRPPVPRTSDPITIEGLTTCRDGFMTVDAVRENAAAWMGGVLGGLDDRRALSLIAHPGGVGSPELFRNNAFECLPARIDYFDATLPYGTGSTFTLEIVTDLVERG